MLNPKVCFFCFDSQERGQDTNACYFTAGEEGAEKKKRGERKEKEVFRVAFPSPDAEGESSTSSLKELTKSIFAPPGPRGAGIDMPKAKLRAKPKGRGRKRKDDSDDEDEEEGKRDANMLPDDMHFTSRQLVTLFLKPRFSVRSLFSFRIFILTVRDNFVSAAKNAGAAGSVQRAGRWGGGRGVLGSGCCGCWRS